MLLYVTPFVCVPLVRAANKNVLCTNSTHLRTRVDVVRSKLRRCLIGESLFELEEDEQPSQIPSEGFARANSQDIPNLSNTVLFSGVFTNLMNREYGHWGC